MRFRVRARWPGLIAAGALLVGGIAYASIPDANGVIHACYRTDGDSRFQVINAPSQRCPVGWTALDFNQTGPIGPSGRSGATGASGDAGCERGQWAKWSGRSAGRSSDGIHRTRQLLLFGPDRSRLGRDRHLGRRWWRQQRLAVCGRARRRRRRRHHWPAAGWGLQLDLCNGRHRWSSQPERFCLERRLRR